MVMFDEHTNPVVICVVLAITGAGPGNIFQPCLIALQAHCRKSQRAVVISNRNFLRALGGAVGLGSSSLVMQTALKKSLPPKFQYLVHSAYRLPDFATFTAEEERIVVHSYREAVRTVFIVLTPLMGISLLGCGFIKDRGLQREEEKKTEGQSTPEAPGLVQLQVVSRLEEAAEFKTE